MAAPRSRWINVLAGTVGGFAFGHGLLTLTAFGFSLLPIVWAVLGFLVLGWAVLDLRRYTPGTPESEVDGGRTIE